VVDICERTSLLPGSCAYLGHPVVIGVSPTLPATDNTSLLKATFKALRRISPCPWRIGAITAAALALLHHLHGLIT